MKYLVTFFLALIFFINIGCRGTKQSQSFLTPLQYDHAVELVIQYVLTTEYYEKEEDVRFIYEPDNTTWLFYGVPSDPYFLEEHGLLNRNYYAFFLLGKNAGDRGDDLFVFVDKDKSQIIGVKNGWSFENVEYRYRPKSNIESQDFCYDKAVQVLKQYVLDLGFYESQDDIRFIYEPSNGYWNRRIISRPELPELCGLKNKDYYAFNILSRIANSENYNEYIFVDKDEKKVIGMLYEDGRFAGNTFK